MLSELSNDFKNFRLATKNLEIMDKYNDFKEMTRDELRQIIFNEISTNASRIDASLKKRTTYLFTISDLIEKLRLKNLLR